MRNNSFFKRDKRKSTLSSTEMYESKRLESSPEKKYREVLGFVGMSESSQNNESLQKAVHEEEAMLQASLKILFTASTMNQWINSSKGYKVIRKRIKMLSKLLDENAKISLSSDKQTVTNYSILTITNLRFPFIIPEEFRKRSAGMIFHAFFTVEFKNSIFDSDIIDCDSSTQVMFVPKIKIPDVSLEDKFKISLYYVSSSLVTSMRLPSKSKETDPGKAVVKFTKFGSSEVKIKDLTANQSQNMIFKFTLVSSTIRSSNENMTAKKQFLAIGRSSVISPGFGSSWLYGSFCYSFSPNLLKQVPFQQTGEIYANGDPALVANLTRNFLYCYSNVKVMCKSTLVERINLIGVQTMKQELEDSSVLVLENPAEAIIVKVNFKDKDGATKFLNTLNLYIDQMEVWGPHIEHENMKKHNEKLREVNMNPLAVYEAI